MILDTTALIDLLRGEKDILERISKLEDSNETFSTTTISVFELWQGTKDIQNEHKKKKIHQLLDAILIFMFDVVAAKRAGELHASLKKQGKIIDPEDSMIAGIAQIQNETVLTRNIKHFERITALKLESY